MVKRLTYWNDKGRGSALPVAINEDGDTVDLETLCAKLAHFEDLQEQGRLAELPCKVGDTVYETSSIFSKLKEPKAQTVKGFSRWINEDLVLLCDNGVKIRQSKINRTVFLTQAEAQAALERMEENING